MAPKSSRESILWLFRWAFVVYCTLAPRVVAHSHEDFQHQGNAAERVALHLAQYHSLNTTVDANTLHFHWAFSPVPSESPAHPAVLASQQFNSDCDLLAVECHRVNLDDDYRRCFSTRLLGNNPPVDDRLHDPSFKRLLFNVWIL